MKNRVHRCLMYDGFTLLPRVNVTELSFNFKHFSKVPQNLLKSEKWVNSFFQHVDGRQDDKAGSFCNVLSGSSWLWGLVKYKTCFWQDWWTQWRWSYVWSFGGDLCNQVSFVRIQKSLFYVILKINFCCPNNQFWW